MKRSGIFFYIKDLEKNDIWNASFDGRKRDKYTVTFSADRTKYTKLRDNIETEINIICAQTFLAEIRSITIKNKSNEDKEIETICAFEPVLSRKEEDIAHPAFNNLFLKYDLSENGDIIIKRSARSDLKNSMYLGANLFAVDNENINTEFEISLSNLYKNLNGQGNFSNQIGLVTDPVVAFKKKIKLKANDEITLNLVISVSENLNDVIGTLEYYKIPENAKMEFNISKTRVEEEARYLGIKRQDLIAFQNILPYIMTKNPTKSLYLDKLPKKEYKQSDFWKYGISGDIPIILVKIKSLNDVYVVKEVLKVFEYMRTKGIRTDLIILDYEKNVYEQYVKEQIIQEILNMQIGYLQNVSSGIFILNNNEIEDEKLFEYRANIVIPANSGNLTDIIKEMEEEYKLNLRNIGEDKKAIKEIPEFEKIKPNIDFEKLKYYNGYGGFSEDGKEYIIKINKEKNVPVPWSNVLANENFGTVVTSNMGGYTWSKNSRLNRISAWGNNPARDIPSEIIYLKDMDYGKVWTLNASPMPDDEDYYITYGFGYASYYHASLGIIQELEVFVPKEDSIKTNIIRFKNTTSEKRKFKVIYYVKPVLGEDELKTDGYIDLEFENNTIYAKNTLYDGLSKIVYVSSSEKILSYTGNNLFFVGEKSLENPVGINKQELNMENSLGNPTCIAVEIEIELEPYENKEFTLMLGEEDTKGEIEKQVEKYQNLKNAQDELKKEKEYWNKILRTIQVKTPSDQMDIMLNGWAMYQTIVCRLFARSGYYQSGGAFGFRDQLQDSLSTKFILPHTLREQTIKHSQHQFEEGDVEHWWHEETKRGIRTRFSDDLLWLAYAVCEYIEMTGDYTILDEETCYIKGAELLANEDERYDIYEESNLEESIYNHCIKAIEKVLNFGENGLPKIGSGDWNDGFSRVGNKGIGESVWLGFFMYDILNRFNKICIYIGKTDYVEKYEKIKNELKVKLNENGWDGNWYKRAFMDTGEVLGSSKNEECKIDSIAQSWSVISKAGDNKKIETAMESLEKYLVNKEVRNNKIIRSTF